MALTADQQALLDALVAKQSEPEPRTETGLAGILHALIDTVSGAVAHRGADSWAELHQQAEQLAAPAPAEEAPAAEAPADEAPAEKAPTE